MSHTTPEDFLSTRIGVVQGTIKDVERTIGFCKERGTSPLTVRHFEETVTLLKNYESELQQRLAASQTLTFAHPDFREEESHVEHTTDNRL